MLYIQDHKKIEFAIYIFYFLGIKNEKLKIVWKKFLKYSYYLEFWTKTSGNKGTFRKLFL